MIFGSKEYWASFTKAQKRINKDPELNRDQKLDILLYIVLSNENPENWIERKPIEGN